MRCRSRGRYSYNTLPCEGWFGFRGIVKQDRAECLVLDAAEPGAEPVARVRLPERIYSGTHAYWHAATP